MILAGLGLILPEQDLNLSAQDLNASSCDLTLSPCDLTQSEWALIFLVQNSSLSAQELSSLSECDLSLSAQGLSFCAQCLSSLLLLTIYNSSVYSKFTASKVMKSLTASLTSPLLNVCVLQIIMGFTCSI